MKKILLLLGLFSISALFAAQQQLPGDLPVMARAAASTPPPVDYDLYPDIFGELDVNPVIQRDYLGTQKWTKALQIRAEEYANLTHGLHFVPEIKRVCTNIKRWCYHDIHLVQSLIDELQQELTPSGLTLQQVQEIQAVIVRLQRVVGKVYAIYNQNPVLIQEFIDLGVSSQPAIQEFRQMILLVDQMLIHLKALTDIKCSRFSQDPHNL